MPVNVNALELTVQSNMTFWELFALLETLGVALREVRFTVVALESGFNISIERSKT